MELRSDRGEPLQTSSDGEGLNRRAAVRIGAAVLAVPAIDVPRYVARIPTGTFVLSQRVDEPPRVGPVAQRQAARYMP